MRDPLRAQVLWTLRGIAGMANAMPYLVAPITDMKDSR